MRATFRMFLYLAAVCVGSVLVAINLWPEWIDRIVAYLKAPQGQLLSSGLATIFLLCPLYLVLRWWQLHRYAREISYTTESGKVSVSLIAVEEALTRVVEAEHGVKKAEVRVYEDRAKRQVIIDTVLTMWEVPNVTERNRACQQLIRRRFNELMPEQTAVQVNLTVHRLTQRREDGKKTAAPAEPVAPAAPLVEGADAHPGVGSGEEPGEGDALAGLGRKHSTGLSEPLLAGGQFAGEAAPQPSEEDLYVGPTYPVVKDDDDDASASSYHPRPAPAPGKTVGKNR